MTINYAKFIELMSALDEYFEGQYSRKRLMREIYWHYMSKYGYIVAININNCKVLLQDYGQAGKKTLKCNYFVHFMDQPKKQHNEKRNRKHNRKA